MLKPELVLGWETWNLKAHALSIAQTSFSMREFALFSEVCSDQVLHSYVEAFCVCKVGGTPEVKPYGSGSG